MSIAADNPRRPGAERPSAKQLISGPEVPGVGLPLGAEFKVGCPRPPLAGKHEGLPVTHDAIPPAGLPSVQHRRRDRRPGAIARRVDEKRLPGKDSRTSSQVGTSVGGR